MTKTIAQTMVEILNEWGLSSVTWGDNSIDECCLRTDRIDLHPLDRNKCVLAALELSPFFVKCYVRLHRRVRSFELKNSSEN